MAEKHRVSYDCVINIPEITMIIDGKTKVVMPNHSTADIELEPGQHTIHADYTMWALGQPMDYTRDVVVSVMPGDVFEAKICPVIKMFSFVKNWGASTRCC